MIRPLRVVGLDLSTAATAIAGTHDGNGLPFLNVFTVPGTAKQPLHHQIDVIETAVRRSCGADAAGRRPDLAVIEGTFSRKGPSDYPLHALQANVRQWLYRRGIPYTVVAPATVKSWATGSGATRGVNKVTKDRVVTAILATYGARLLINPRDDNQSDAVALLTLGLAAYGQPLADVPAANRKAIKAVDWPELRER